MRAVRSLFETHLGRVAPGHDEAAGKMNQRFRTRFVGFVMGMQQSSVLVGPTDPDVCIGNRQALEKEADVECCRQPGLPIWRREVGSCPQ